MSEVVHQPQASPAPWQPIPAMNDLRSSASEIPPWVPRRSQIRGVAIYLLNGVIELRPSLPVPADQAWFWAARWQQREREIDEHVAAGRVTVHENGDGFLAHLDALESDGLAWHL
ncbi:hypothetical protein [Microbacterium paludicola]|uniref:hypothetical protein n=1 Tax=Microbacterium paludicola TaxID=300019 RepID=UPI001D15FD5A|nr:hypothetical protein [Microbacterium paludicola]